MKAIYALAVAASLLAGPALAQYGSPDQQQNRNQAANPNQDQQQAERQERRHQGAVETLKTQPMTSPNVRGEKIPQDPITGLPRPGANPSQLDDAHRP